MPTKAYVLIETSVGTTLIKSILDDAQREGRQVDLSVLKVNHRARKLYELLGFSPTEETDTHYHMQALPDRSTRVTPWSVSSGDDDAP